MMFFSWPLRVYYEDTDSGGVVYHANYLRFLECARTEWLRQLGFEQDELRRNEGIVFAVRDAQLAYHRPARFNDRLNVVTTVPLLRKASMTFAQHIYRHESTQMEDQTLLCTAEVRVACICAQSFRPTAIPPALWTELNRER